MRTPKATSWPAKLGRELYRGLMRCHVALGRHAEALSTYQRRERVLRGELGIPPGRETRALFDALRERGPATQ